MKNIHIYLFLFSITLVSLGSCGKEDAQPDPTASFTKSRPMAWIGEDISFTNTSQNATDYLWNFGDGETSSEENVTYAWSDCGEYIVSLTAKSDGKTSSTSDTVLIFPVMPGVWLFEIH